MKLSAVILVYLAAATSAVAADLDLHLPPGQGGIVAGPALIPPCREAWSTDVLLRCRRVAKVDPTSPAAREQLQTLERRAKPYPELFSWSH